MPDLPASPISIRRGTPDDLAEIQHLNQGLFDYENALGCYSDNSFNINWPTSPAGTKYFREHLAGDPTKATFLAQADDRPVGFITAKYSDYPFRIPSLVGELEIMFVTEAYRRQGIGGQLVQALKAWAHSHNVGRLRVGAFAGNQLALNFYHKQGFADMEINLERAL